MRRLPRGVTHEHLVRAADDGLNELADRRANAHTEEDTRVGSPAKSVEQFTHHAPAGSGVLHEEYGNHPNSLQMAMGQHRDSGEGGIGPDHEIDLNKPTRRLGSPDVGETLRNSGVKHEAGPHIMGGEVRAEAATHGRPEGGVRVGKPIEHEMHEDDEAPVSPSLEGDEQGRKKAASIIDRFMRR